MSPPARNPPPSHPPASRAMAASCGALAGSRFTSALLQPARPTSARVRVVACRTRVSVGVFARYGGGGGGGGYEDDYGARPQRSSGGGGGGYGERREESYGGRGGDWQKPLNMSSNAFYTDALLVIRPSLDNF